MLIEDAIERQIAELRDAGAVERALGVGDTAPNFELHTLAGDMFSSAGALAKGPLMVTFFRGSWCPYCTLESSELAKLNPEIRALGARHVAISPQSAGTRSGELPDLPFDILIDPGATVAQAFGVAYEMPGYLRDLVKDSFGLDLSKVNADGTWRLPMPATFVIDRFGTIRYASVKADFRTRPNPQEALAVLRA